MRRGGKGQICVSKGSKYGDKEHEPTLTRKLTYDTPPSTATRSKSWGEGDEAVLSSKGGMP